MKTITPPRDEEAVRDTDGTMTNPSQPAVAEPGSTADPKDKIKELVEEIRSLQKLEHQCKSDLIDKRIAIGAALVKLKEVIDHGKWAKRLETLGYDNRKAQRLMKLAKSDLPNLIDQIRTGDPDLASWLPVDVQKLETLSRLSVDQLKKALAAWGRDIETMNRKQLRDAVNALCHVPTTDEPAKKAENESVVEQPTQKAVASKGTAASSKELAEDVESPDVSQQEPTEQPQGSSGSDIPSSGNSEHLNRLAGLCDDLSSDELKAGIERELAAGGIDKTASEGLLAKVGSAIAGLEKYREALSQVSNDNGGEENAKDED